MLNVVSFMVIYVITQSNSTTHSILLTFSLGMIMVSSYVNLFISLQNQNHDENKMECVSKTNNTNVMIDDEQMYAKNAQGHELVNNDNDNNNDNLPKRCHQNFLRINNFHKQQEKMFREFGDPALFDTSQFQPTLGFMYQTHGDRDMSNFLMPQSGITSCQETDDGNFHRRRPKKKHSEYDYEAICRQGLTIF